jgi:DNA-binding response OmpR family regulator
MVCKTRPGTQMTKHILLLEPYEAIAHVITDLLNQLGYQTDVLASGTVDTNYLLRKPYHCVLINLDQNTSGWHDYGLRLATLASRSGIPVVMIPDHTTAARTIEANGWLRLKKPFSIANLQDAITLAVAKRQPRSDNRFDRKAESTPDGCPAS